ncbi:Sensor histidine kinase YycG [Paenibacillus konkukensis]|uniref:histidine kinase n=1 Tax=Paenibacillus konkukensis TaxID=2020716 RepID=A0ABY4RP49_9BACL|nr:HAMP domain-containing sensor histidine kinase [Paenibacillus konkukensis]UQZ83092.1 Sensor histidine kinase YycG [Paenibacillus konkukensis]
MSKRERKSLLYYWSIRYFTILFISIMILGLLAMYVFNRNAISAQYTSVENMVGDLGAVAQDNHGRLPQIPDMEGFLGKLAERHNLQSRPIMFILNRDGQVVQQYPSVPPEEIKQMMMRIPDMMSGDAQVIKLEAQQDQEPYLAGIYPIIIESSKAGYALYMAPQRNALDGMFAFRYPRWILLASFLFIGWGIVHVLTRRLIKPIQEAANAAKQIVAGNYNLQFRNDYKEKEIHELTHSFQEMADRLNRLEKLRTQLLAGVTHELKTPVTAISGLVQAVRGKVVEGDEAEAFLDHCMNECNRLQKMVEDLLDFNSFAAGNIQVDRELIGIQTMLTDIVERWSCVQERHSIEVKLEAPVPAANLQLCTDPIRIEQILINLLNNARDAIVAEGVVIVRLDTTARYCHISVHDTGCGIPVAGQKDIFEPFYRGADKRTLVHGLGLGLPFSRMIARSLGGDLVLTHSSTNGSIFELIVPLES